MSELKNGVMLTENALRCVAQDIELYYKKKAPNGAWCIATCRNAAAQFEQMRSELAELRRAQPENEPLICRDCEYASYEWSESNKNTETCHCMKWKRGMKQADFCSYGVCKPERSEG